MDARAPLFSREQYLPSQFTCIYVPRAILVPTEPPAHRSSAIVLTALLGGRSASLPTLLTLAPLVSGLSLALPSSSLLVLLTRLALSFRSFAPPLALRTLAIGLNCAPGGIPIPIPIPAPLAAPPPLRTGDAGYAGVGVKCIKSAMLNFAVPGVVGGKSEVPTPPPGVLKNGSSRTGGGSSVGSPEIEPGRRGDGGGRSIDTEEDAILPPPLLLAFGDVIESEYSTRAAGSGPRLRPCDARTGLGELASSRSKPAASSLPPPAPGGCDAGC